jgi:outer membrane protein assembly factor BamB
MFAIRPADLARGEPAKVAYEIKGSLPYVSTPVAHGDRLFLWGDSGIVSCIDTSSGERIWRERVGGSFFASPVRTGDRIFSVSREGEVVILGTQGEFRLLGRVDLEEPSHSTPAVANGVIFFRTWSHLMAIAGK